MSVAHLTWTPALTPGALFESYQVWRKTDTGAYVLLTTLDVEFGGIDRFAITEPSTYDDDTVTAGHTYTYRINALGADRSDTGTVSSNLIQVTIADTSLRLLEDGSIRLTEDGDRRLLE